MKKPLFSKKVLLAAAECRGLAKVGGLGDVVHDLAQELAIRDISATVVIPAYEALKLTGDLLLDFAVPFGGSLVPAKLLKVRKPTSVNFVLIEAPFFRGDLGEVYVDSQSRGKGPFEDDALRYAFFCRAIHVLLKSYEDFGQFAIIHAHDWHTGLLPWLLKVDPPHDSPKTLFTIHNLDYQGIRPWDVPDAQWAGVRQWFPDLWNKLIQSVDFPKTVDPRYPECFNPMRAGILLSDGVNTVSPTYAKEITQADKEEAGFFGGRGLEKDLQSRRDEKRLWGILNGLDYKTFDPVQVSPPLSEDAPLLMQAKQEHRNLFFKSLGIRLEEAASRLGSRFKNSREVLLHEKDFLKAAGRLPLYAMITRAASQKLGLFLDPWKSGTVAEAFLQRPLSFILIGSGERERDLAFLNETPNALFLNLFDPGLAEALYAAADAFVMPSDFEPCGLSQMISMRFGTPPLVHDRGGLHDTVAQGKTGFVFSGRTRKSARAAFLKVVDESLDLHARPQEWEKLVRQAMSQRFDWDSSVEQYIEIYRSLGN